MSPGERPRVPESPARARAVGDALSHLLIISVSAGLAFALPGLVRLLAMNLLAYWSFIEDEKAFLVSVEVIFALGLVVLAHGARGVWRNRRRAAVAASAGVTGCFRPASATAQRRARRLKERQGVGRDVLIMGVTGHRTFARPDGDLHEVLKRCRGARILLLNPYGRAARTRARSLLLDEVTPERFQKQVAESIDFLRGLRARLRDIRLKLYDDPPLLKLAVLGEHVWLKHYHPGTSASALPEYLVEDVGHPGGLYAALYQYFVSRWDDPTIPELDFETDELVHCDATGRELRREPFTGRAPGTASGVSARP